MNSEYLLLDFYPWISNRNKEIFFARELLKLKFKDIAKAYKITPTRVYQIHSKCLRIVKARYPRFLNSTFNVYKCFVKIESLCNALIRK